MQADQELCLVLRFFLRLQLAFLFVHLIVFVISDEATSLVLPFDLVDIIVGFAQLG